jgi:Mg2+/citrate symporter
MNYSKCDDGYQLMNRRSSMLYVNVILDASTIELMLSSSCSLYCLFIIGRCGGGEGGLYVMVLVVPMKYSAEW